MNFSELTSSYKKELIEANLIHDKDALVNFYLPNNKIEENWKYSNLTKVLPKKLINEKLSIPMHEIDIDGIKIEFNNGEVQEKTLDLPKGVTLTKEENICLKSPNNPFTQLNRSLQLNEYKLTIEENTYIEQPIIVIHKATGPVYSSRLKIKIEKNSKASLIEISAGVTECSLKLPLSEVIVCQNSNLEHVFLTLDQSSQAQIIQNSVSLKRDSTYTGFQFLLDGKYIRSNIDVKILEKGAHAYLDGLFTPQKQEKCDIHSSIEHIAGSTFSDQLFKGILSDESHGSFTGEVIIPRDSQKVEANQLSKNLLLSNKAKIDSRPVLIISADDVKANHGATIGQISDEELFYLQTRGLTKQRGRKLLAHAFGIDAINKLKTPSITKFLKKIYKEDFANNREELAQ